MLQLLDVAHLSGTACIHRHVTMSQGQVKGIDPVVWPISPHTHGLSRNSPSASGTRFCDWIGGICYAESLQVWVPAHLAPVVLHQLQHTEDAYRAAHQSWMDLEVAPDDIKKQWQEANDNRRMQFKVGNFKDSNIRILPGTIKADWIQLSVERYLTALPTLKQGCCSLGHH